MLTHITAYNFQRPAAIVSSRHAIPRVPRWHANIRQLMTTVAILAVGCGDAPWRYIKYIVRARVARSTFPLSRNDVVYPERSDAIARMSRSPGQGRTHASPLDVAVTPRNPPRHHPDEGRSENDNKTLKYLFRRRSFASRAADTRDQRIITLAPQW